MNAWIPLLSFAAGGIGWLIPRLRTRQGLAVELTSLGVAFICFEGFQATALPDVPLIHFTLPFLATYTALRLLRDTLRQPPAQEAETSLDTAAILFAATAPAICMVQKDALSFGLCWAGALFARPKLGEPTPKRVKLVPVMLATCLVGVVALHVFVGPPQKPLPTHPAPHAQWTFPARTYPLLPKAE